MLDVKKTLIKICQSIYGIKPYILNSRTTFASSQPIIFSNYDSGLKTISANSVSSCDATVSDKPSGYTGYIIRCRVQNGTGGVNESGCCPYNFYFLDNTTLRASVSNRFSSQAKVHVHFTVLCTSLASHAVPLSVRSQEFSFSSTTK